MHTWGAFSETYSNGGNGTAAYKNPFLYRGYYYDRDINFYYLNSRYYDFKTGRFINADGYVTTGQGLIGANMFAYCGNNPIIRYDPRGEFFITSVFAGSIAYKIGVTIAGIFGALILADTIAKPITPPPSLPSIETNKKVETNSKAEEIVPALPKTQNEYHKHHIVAQDDHRAAEARKILMDVDIFPRSDPLNIVLRPKNYHLSLHTTAYHNYVIKRLRIVAGDRAGVEDTLLSLRMEIIARCEAGIRWD